MTDDPVTAAIVDSLNRKKLASGRRDSLFITGVRVPELAIKLLNDRSDDAKHDIESIEIHVVKQDEPSISIEKNHFLRGLQDMYRNRIVSKQAEISKLELRAEACTGEPLEL